MNDYAVLVGITNYPGIHNLDGAVNDVKNFESWLLNEGGLLKENIKQVITRPPHSTNIADATPVENDVKVELTHIVSKGVEVMKADSDEELRQKKMDFYRDESGMLYLGRRLYFFLSGHGFAASFNPNDASLIMANGDYGMYITNHINGVKYVDWFQAAAYFKEIVLVMDCCRTIEVGVPSLSPFRENREPTGKPVNCFYALSTSYERISREIDVNGKKQGAFTTLFLEALRKAKPNSDNQITWEELKAYIWNNSTKHLPPGYTQEPQIRESDSRHTIVLVNAVEEESHSLIFNFTADKIGKTAIILNGMFQQVKTLKITDISLTINLPIGLYKIMIVGTESSLQFEIAGEQSISLTI